MSLLLTDTATRSCRRRVRLAPWTVAQTQDMACIVSKPGGRVDAALALLEGVGGRGAKDDAVLLTAPDGMPLGCRSPSAVGILAVRLVSTNNGTDLNLAAARRSRRHQVLAAPLHVPRAKLQAKLHVLSWTSLPANDAVERWPRPRTSERGSCQAKRSVQMCWAHFA